MNKAEQVLKAFRERLNEEIELTELQKVFLLENSDAIQYSITLYFKEGKFATKEDKKFFSTEYKRAKQNRESPKRVDLVSLIALIFFYIKLEPSQYKNQLRAINRVLYAILSFKEHEVIGYQFDKLIQVAHTIYPGQKQHMEIFLSAVEIYYGMEKLLQHDFTGKFIDKLNMYYAERPKQDLENVEIIKIIFKELAK